MKQQIRHYQWPDGKKLTVGEHTAVMGILNITPDSFSDGGKWMETDLAVSHMKDMVRDGAEIIDVGAESSHPGFTPVSAEEEMKRLMPRLEVILKEAEVPVSVDTFKAKTAEAAIRAGAHIINDIWGLQWEDGDMARVAGETGVPVIVMHNRDGHVYERDIIDEIKIFFAHSVEMALRCGVKEENIILDPGIGFGKTAAQNVIVLHRLQELTSALPFPFLMGASRKGFIGQILDLPVTERMEGTAAVTMWAQMAGCSIMRVHDVKPVSRMTKVMDVLQEGTING